LRICVWLESIASVSSLANMMVKGFTLPHVFLFVWCNVIDDEICSQ